MITISGTIPRSIFPVRPNTKGIPFGPPFDTDGSPMWKPFQERDPSSDEIAAWNRITIPHNWALVLGRASGLVVVDVDPRHGGDETIKKYPMPLTHTVRTPSSGFHYYFACPMEGCRSQLSFDKGVEIKGDGNLVLVPPSNKNGVKYEIVDGTENLPPAPLPAWARAATTKPMALGQWREAFGDVPIGEQHPRLVSLCGYLARFLPRVHWPAIPVILWHFASRYNQNDQDPWTPLDIEQIVASVCDSEKRASPTRYKVRVLG